MLKSRKSYESNQDKSKQNILFSLDYLREEAKRAGNNELFDILNAASFLAKGTDDGLENNTPEYPVNEDSINAAIFIVKFFSASKEAQQKALRMIIQMEDETIN